jgi:hypothetical protein
MAHEVEAGQHAQIHRIVAEFIALPVESISFCAEVFPAFVFMPLRHLRCRFRKALRRVEIAQPRQGHIAALGGSLRGIERQPIKPFGLDFFDRSQNFVRLAELAVLDRLLRLRLQRGDFRVVAGLCRRRRLKVLEFSCDLDELRREAANKRMCRSPGASRSTISAKEAMRPSQISSFVPSPEALAMAVRRASGSRVSSLALRPGHE